MKIVFLNIYNGRVQRGSEIFVSEIASRLAKKAEVSVCHTGGRNIPEASNIIVPFMPFVPHQGISGSAIHRQLSRVFYELSVLLFTMVSLFSIYKIRPDWVVPVNGGMQALLLRLTRPFFKYKILISGHAGIGAADKWNILIAKPDVFVGLSNEAEKWAGLLSPGMKTAYIPNGIDTSRFYPSGVTMDTGFTGKTVLCVSALLPYKRVLLAIRAVAGTKDAGLLVVGDGPLRQELEIEGERLLPGRFRIITQIDNEYMPSVYRACDVFTLPSEESEAFGMVYLEAMACNVPVVAPDDGKRREITGDGGIYCDVTSQEEYSRALQEALDGNFGNRPRKQAEKFSWDLISEKYLSIFSKHI